MTRQDTGARHTAAPRFSSLTDWLHWQEQLHYPAIALGLDRCRSVAQRLGLLPVPFTVITVGGTNGKGSCTTLLDLILRHAGYRVGRYTSPHLLRYNERVSIGGKTASDQDLCRVFHEIDVARGDITLTFFEFGTLATLLLFREAGIDIAVMEVGLGGRLDAVNILDADVAMVSTIDLDHQGWLGPDRESIGAEKAGIFRSGRPAICADPAPPHSLLAVAERVGARLLVSGRDFSYERRGEVWDWRGTATGMRNLPVPGVPHGRQVQNAAGVLMTLQALSERCPGAIQNSGAIPGGARRRHPGARRGPQRAGGRVAGGKSCGSAGDRQDTHGAWHAEGQES
jgi:dihydrofolate synthase / folylpolyglutamate synthase